MRYFAFNGKNGLVGLLKDYPGYCLAIKYVFFLFFLGKSRKIMIFPRGSDSLKSGVLSMLCPCAAEIMEAFCLFPTKRNFAPMRSLLLDHRSLRQGLLDRRYAEKETRKTSAASDFDRAGGLMGVYDICNWWSPDSLLTYPSKMRIKMKFRWTRVVAAKNNTFDFWRF